MLDQIETAEELQAQIQELESKKQKIELEQAKNERQQHLEEMPLADVKIKLSKFMETEKKGVTPAELTVLVAMHNRRAGGNPILSINPTGTVHRDPRQERARLCTIYKKDRVLKLFPGNEPTLPKTFRRAMENGISTAPETDNYFFKMPLVDATA